VTRWLQSGTRRDICVLVAGAEDGELPAQKLKTALERHYDTRIEPDRFYGSVEALERKGFLQSRTEELTDVYSLTEAGERRLREHYQWMQDNLD